MDEKNDKNEILIVEDDADNLKSLSAIIASAGYRVRCAGSGKSAFRGIQSERPDLIILDVKLPDVDGVEVCRRLKKDALAAGVPVIFISGSDDLQIKVSAFEAGGADYITKPYHPVEVLARITTHLNMARTITECKHAEDALKDSEARLRSVLDATPFPIAIVDSLDDNIIYWSQSAKALFGHTAPTASQWYELAYPDPQYRQDVISQWKPFLEKAKSTGKPVNTGEYRVTCRDGLVRICELYATFIEKNLIVTFSDVTERNQTEKKLRESNDLLSLFVRHSPIYCYIKEVTPTQSKVLHASDNFSDMIGITGRDMIGKTMEELFPPEFAAKMTFDDYAVVSKGVVLHLDEELNGRSYTTIKFPIVQGSKTLLAGYTIDVTERKRTESLLMNTQKLDALGVLAGGIAHDFNNLMGGIFGYIDLANEVANEECADKNVGHYLTRAMSTIDRARGLTQQLLTFAKGGCPVLKTGGLFPFVQETAQFALSGSAVSCRFDVPLNLWPCRFDKNQIGQVIDNIVINAQQAMPSGGTIDISAQNVSFGDKAHPTLAPGKYVKVSIKDAGIGIPKEILPRIFDPFYTTKTTGHGLGLATCFSIVNRHGGCIDVESEPGKGSAFHLYLPAVPKCDAVSLEKKETGKHSGSGTILVMDDAQEILDTIGDMLQSFGYTVVCKENGKGAIDFFSSEIMGGRKIAAMIFDLTVAGGMGGKEAVGEIRKIPGAAAVPVFVSSGYATDPVMADPEKYGFTASICKPFRKQDLAEMLEKYLKK